jgi:DNA-binding GntR family transcriptional regulator
MRIVDTSGAKAGLTTAPESPGVNGAYLAIRDLIIRGRLEPGERVVEAELGVRLGISRTPVREALGRLEHEGFVVPVGAAQRKRLIVAPMSGADFLELCHLIGMYEGLAFSGLDHLTSECRLDLADRLAAVNAQLRASVTSVPQNADSVFELLTRFHKIFFEALAGPRLRAVYASLRPLVERYEWAYADIVEGQIDSSLDEHDLMIAAVRAGSGLTAEAAVRLHWERAGLRVANALIFLAKRGEGRECERSLAVD